MCPARRSHCSRQQPSGVSLKLPCHPSVTALFFFVFLSSGAWGGWFLHGLGHWPRWLSQHSCIRAGDNDTIDLAVWIAVYKAAARKSKHEITDSLYGNLTSSRLFLSRAEKTKWSKWNNQPKSFNNGGVWWNRFSCISAAEYIS